MPRIPNHEKAIIDIDKIRLYCLNPFHPTGKNKARIFRNILGLTMEDSEWLSNQILIGLATNDAHTGTSDKYGKRYTIRIRIRNLEKEAMVITGWIIKKDEDFPRLTTCYIKL